MSLNPLRGIPSVNELLESPRLKRLVERIHPGAVIATVRAVLDEVAAEVHAVATDRTLPSVTELAERIARRVMATESPGLRPVINATGLVFHPRLGPPPLAERAIEAMAAASRDYTTPKKPSAGELALVEQLLGELCGAEAALVTSTAAGATVLALAALADGRGVVVRRGHVLRRGPDYSLPALALAARATLHEVGAANHATREDYAEALGEWTGALLAVEPPEAAGETSGPTLAELVERGREAKVPVIDDLGPAAILDLEPLGLPGVPLVRRSVSAGADVVVLGHELLGAPPCGILLGRRHWIEPITTHPMAPPLRASAATLAALAATLELHRDPDQARRLIPVLQLLTTSPENLASRARRLAPQMAACRAIAAAEPVEMAGPGGGGVARVGRLPTWCVELKPARVSAADLCDALGGAQPAVIARRESDRVLLDLRGVLTRQDLNLVEAILGLDKPPLDPPDGRD